MADGTGRRHRHAIRRLTAARVARFVAAWHNSREAIFRTMSRGPWQEPLAMISAMGPRNPITTSPPDHRPRAFSGETTTIGSTTEAESTHPQRGQRHEHA